MQRVEESIRVAAPISHVYELWHNFEDFPRFMKHVEDVRWIDDIGGRSHWKLKGPVGMTVEYDAEVTEDEPDRSIGWRSLDGNIGSSGNITFTELEGETLVHAVVQWYDPPGGAIGEALSGMLQNPHEMLKEDLHRFKLFAEGQNLAAA
jgi:uncharacterized membrane protein